MKTAIGLDLYNQVVTGQKTMTLCASRNDHEHIPCVLVSMNTHAPSQYYMTDKAGHMCRWKLLDKAMTLQASDYKDPPSILTERGR